MVEKDKAVEEVDVVVNDKEVEEEEVVEVEIIESPNRHLIVLRQTSCPR